MKKTTIGDVMIQTTITNDNINNGRIKCNDKCPIALSFNKHKDVAHVSIFDTHSWLYLKKKENGKTVMLDFYHSKELLDFVKKFDNKEKVLPQSFLFDETLLRKKIIL
tara:strand:- start:3123 stop:3446 length:324 start_codon:yes stop_codon:yes gene_type:complete